MANKKINLLINSLKSQAASPSNENINRMLKSTVYTKKKKNEIIIPSAVIKPKENETVINDEHYILDKIIQKRIIKHNNYFQQHKYLFKTSVEPKHLTILNENLAKETKLLIEANLNKSSKTLIEMQPGVCLMTKELITNENLINFILIEPYKTFNNYSQEIKLSNRNKNVIIESGQYPFKWYQKFSKYEHFFNESPVSIFGILPWSLYGYLRHLYKLFSFHRILFEFRHDPEFFFYVPEHFLARLMPESNENFRPFNSALSVYSSILSKVSVLSKQSVEEFYPYPIKKWENRNNNNQPYLYPYTLLNCKNIYLIHIKFDKTLVSDDNRASFFHFIHQLWSQPKVMLGEALRHLSCTGSTVQDLENKFGQNRLNTQICDLHALEFYEVFDSLSTSSLFNNLNKLEEFYKKDTLNEFKNS